MIQGCLVQGGREEEARQLKEDSQSYRAGEGRRLAQESLGEQGEKACTSGARNSGLCQGGKDTRVSELLCDFKWGVIIPTLQF